jgi:hypothetical protein
MSEETDAGQATDEGSNPGTREGAEPGGASDVLHRTDDDNDRQAEKLATAASTVERRTEGWGGNPDAPALSDEQVARLQEHEEPVAAANFGAQLTGDLGNAEVADETTNAPETVEPDTSLGHEGGSRYQDYAGGPEGADGSA